MHQPFVRDVFADVERLSSFQRVASHLRRRTGDANPAERADQLGEGAGRMGVSGVDPTAKALLCTLLAKAAARPLLLIVADNRAAEALVPVLEAFAELTGALRAEEIVLLPATDVLPFQNLSPHPEIQEERATALWKIALGAARLVVAPLAAAAMRLQEPEYYAELACSLRRGETVDVDALLAHLRSVGYQSADVVEMPGEFALRGGILDVYPPEAERPVRAELFGDEVESLRQFDPATQRSLSNAEVLDEVVLLPLSETPVVERLLAVIHARLSGRRVEGSSPELVEQAMRAGGVAVFPGWEFFAPVAGAPCSLLQLMPEAAVLLEEPSALAAEEDRWRSKVAEAHERSLMGNLVRPEELYFSPEEFWAGIAQRPGVALEQLAIESSTAGLAGEPVHIASQPSAKFHGSLPLMAEAVKTAGEAGQRVLFSVGSMGEMERLAEVFREYGLPYHLGTRGKLESDVLAESAHLFSADAGAAVLVRAFIPTGVVLPEARLSIFGMRDLFDESESQPQPKRGKQSTRSKTSAFLSDFRDLAIGDYVVHVEHGIAQYLGLKEIAQGDGSIGEYMGLEFAEAAKLYVPLTRLDLVQKYRSGEGAAPTLSRLGTQQWAKTKAKVKKAIADMTDELLKLYAQRKVVQGHAFKADSQFEAEFADAFEFNPTDDQVQAFADIAVDMESRLPMDRLLCGDVGFGKTEVAMRAAFKAVDDSKQVAVLAPTTILAFQHFESFKRRFAAFPVTVEMISRFRTPKQQKEIIERVEAGKVDILIGTHRLLSKDVKFHDLGLLVIDEEQRFGVRAKERLKQLRKQVDVLAMSATPIPRTLHMSLVGLRDMSVIETPPRDRMSIQTVVAAWDEKLIRNAIEQEMDRGGQVYFVHNRVESIYEVAAKLQALVPRARILVGHGQMGESELEKTMFQFVRHDADILVATTIIENGLDIPRCNTILINRADRHGLSELYQLRGRVGRSNLRAYAYLLIPFDTELTPIARRRLSALKEFSDLGAGFKIAALDLELRGAGNLLGGEQSGSVDAVGFELYTSMLERAVKEVKGEAMEDETEATLNLGLTIRIPQDYIQEENQRLRMYKRIAGVESEKKLADVRGELTDRYGEPPAAVKQLLEYAQLRLLCRQVGVTGIERKRDTVSVRFAQDAKIDPAKLAQFVAKERGAQFTPDGMLKFALKVAQPEEVLGRLEAWLKGLA